MNKILSILLRFQVLIALMTVCIAAIFVPDHWKSVLAGTTVSMIAVIAMKLMLRRIPVVVKPREFYYAMIACEAVKWLVVVMLSAVYLKMKCSALGILIGFSVTYTISYAAVWLRK